MANTQAFIGIDVGTTSVKALLVDEIGHIINEASVEQKINFPYPSWAEQDPEMWWSNTKTAIIDVLTTHDRSPTSIDIQAIGLSGQMHSSVFLDSKGEVIRPAILWNDGRTSSQRNKITTRIGISRLNETVGNLPLEGFTITKLLWLRDNEPINYSRLNSLLLPKDFIRMKLTGETATENSDASGTILFDIHKLEWSKEILEDLDLPKTVFPKVTESTDISGRVTKTVSKTLGIKEGIPVISGGADNAAGAVATGAVSKGIVQASIGTSGTVLTTIDRPSVDTKLRLHTFCHCAKNKWYLMGTTLTAGSSLKWLRQLLMEIPDETSYESMIRNTSHNQPGAAGLFFLPYLSGERTPHNNPDARGVFFGMHMNHEKKHFTQAVLEGVCYAMKDSLNLMSKNTGEFKDLRIIGGGSRSIIWRQVLANITGVPVSTTQPEGGPAYGAALMAAVGNGHFDTVEQVTEEWTSLGETIEPNLIIHEIYEELYEEYRMLYGSLRENFIRTAHLLKQINNKRAGI